MPLLANSKATVLITGMTGTGKELFARALHYCSPRHDKPFIPVNCGALPDHLCENELFGHAKGAYTDASAAENGLIASAEGGTLFLDEIDSLTAPAQTKFLRFLQDGEYRPLGHSKSIVANVRIIVASNADLWRSVEEKQFREDLYYRLNILCLDIPPLRDRLEDIPALVEHFLSRYAIEQNRGHLQFAPDALTRLLSYSWPGNVRQLEAIIQRAVILCPSGIIRAADIDLPAQELPYAEESHKLREAKTRNIGEFERTYLINLLCIHKGNVTHSARAAGKDRRGFSTPAAETWPHSRVLPTTLLESHLSHFLLSHFLGVMPRR